MTLAGPPDPPNPLLSFLLNLFRAVFGHWQWSAPGWIFWSGRQVRRSTIYLAADPRRLAAALLATLTAAGAIAWYELRPRPHYTEYTVKAPDLTKYDEKGISSIDPLLVTFSESAALLTNLDKRLTFNIAISPAWAGAWTWTDDKHLQFAPKSDWPVDASFTVTIARKGFLARTTLLEDYSFKFKTQPFSANFKSTEFYQDPQNPTLKKVVATVAFSHPVDTTQFEKYVTLIPGKNADFLGLTPDSRHFTVVYDKFRLAAHIHSASLGMPRDDTSLTVRVDNGVRAARGGNQTGDRLESLVAIPGRTSLRFSEPRMTLVDNARYEPEQVLLLTSSSPVAEKAFVGKVQGFLLPVRHPNQPKEQKEPYNWDDDTRIGSDILQKSAPLPLTNLYRIGWRE
jgi:hypothetical protein